MSTAATVESAAGIGAAAAEKASLNGGKGYQKSTDNENYKTVCVHEYLCVGSGGGVNNKSASMTATPLGISANADASVAEARAHVHVVEDVLEGRAEAALGKRSAHFGYGSKDLALVGAEASVAKVSAGISNTPLQAHAALAGVGVEAGISWNYFGANIGAHLAEAKLGPFGVRAGFKFGGGIRNGIPEADLGPITVPVFP